MSDSVIYDWIGSDGKPYRMVWLPEPRGAQLWELEIFHRGTWMPMTAYNVLPEARQPSTEPSGEGA